MTAALSRNRGRSGGPNPTSFCAMKDILRWFLIPAVLLAVLSLPGGAVRADEGGRVQITVVAPPDAEIFFDGEPTVQKGAERLFVSPPLAAGSKYHYDISARWTEGGKTVEQTRRVVFTGGAAVRVDFLTPAPADKGAGDAVGKSVGAPGRLFGREGGPGGAWRPVGDKAPVYADELLIGLLGDEIETPDGSVHWRLLKYFNSPLPVMEPAATPHKAAGCDLDVTLERGFAEFWNAREKGSARVRIRVRGETWEATLEEPGARLLVELYSAWPKGVRFTKKPGPKDVPLAEMTFLVLKGEVDLEHAGTQLALGAPPGPALIQWDSATGMDDSPRRLEELPAWVLPPKDEAGKALAKKIDDMVGRFADAAVKADSPDPAIDQFLASDDPLDRRLAVVALTATDGLGRLAKVLKETDKPDVWENAVLALRHWIGRAPGQDQRLYQGVIDSKIFTPTEAETALELLHDFGDDDAARPVTYEMLIHLLDSDKRFIRGMAYWHLSRLAPEGKKFGYDPFAPQEARDAAVKKWKEYIPAGKLPPPPKEDGK